MIEKINEQLQKNIDRYFNLNIGGKILSCPYYINSKVVRGNLRVMSGKGTPEEIELETKIWAKVKGFDLDNAGVSEIRKFMLDMKIGIDCSGFVVNVFDKYLSESKGKRLINYLKFPNTDLISKFRRFLRPVENIGANVLTSVLNCKKIENVNDIQPGDLIRAKGKMNNAHHVGMVVEIEFEIENNQKVLKSFVYVNSHRFYGEENGMRYGEVEILDSSKGLKEQNWKDIHTDGRNYFYEDLLVDYEDNGVRRLKFPLN